MDKRNLFTETLTAQKMRDRLETKLLSLRNQRQFDFLMKNVSVEFYQKVVFS